MIGGKYTIVLKTLLDDPKSKELIDKALSTYPLYTPEHKAKFTEVMTREELNERLLNHFKYREIGFETFGRWLDELEIAMKEIMPYYNQLFISQDIINGLDDIFGNLDVKEEFEEETTGSGSSSDSETETIDSEVESAGSGSSSGSDSSETNSSITTNGKQVKSDTPQSQIKVEEINDVQYADNIGWNKDNSDTESSTTGTTSTTNTSENTTTTRGTNSSSKESETSTSGTTKHTLHRKGNQGVNTYAHDMLEFRDLFINIVQQIINDKRIQELFMQVY